MSAATLPCRHGVSFVPHMVMSSPPGERHPQTRQQRTPRSGVPPHHEYTYFIADAEAKAPWSELMRGSIEALYGSDDDWGAKEVISNLDSTESTCVHYLAWIAERGTIGAGSLQPYLSAINTFLFHTGRDNAPATGLAIAAA
eukprot:jgi/Tetstr1/448884/TSEL_036110.t1